MLLACACGGLLLAALLLRPRLEDLVVRVTLPPRTSVGAEVDCLIEVTNTGSGWSPACHGVHRIDGLEMMTFLVEALPPGAAASQTLPRAADKRGIALTSTVDLGTTAPLGLRARKRTLDLPLQLIVHPAEVPVVVPPPRASSDSTDWVVSRAGTDVHGIREWRPGDDRSQVHWRSSARRGRLVVLEREVPKPGAFALMLAAAPGDENWEAVLAVGAWTGAAAANAGRDVILVSAAAGLTDPGPDDATTLLDWCAASSPKLPDEPELYRVFSFVGRSGTVAVAAGRSAYDGWWQWASSLASAHDINLVALPVEPVVAA